MQKLNIEKMIPLLKDEYIVVNPKSDMFQTYMIISNGVKIIYLEFHDRYHQYGYRLSNLHRPNKETGSAIGIFDSPVIFEPEDIVKAIKDAMNYKSSSKEYATFNEWLDDKYNKTNYEIWYKGKSFSYENYIKQLKEQK